MKVLGLTQSFAIQWQFQSVSTSAVFTKSDYKVAAHDLLFSLHTTLYPPDDAGRLFAGGGRPLPFVCCPIIISLE